LSREYRIQNRTYEELTRLNKLVSNKKSRYRRDKGIELNPLIQTMKPSEFKSAKDVQKYKREMERFLDRKSQFVANKQGTIFTKQSVDRYHKEVNRINEQKEREFNRIQKLETKALGKKLGVTVGKRMQNAPKDLFPSLTKLTGSLDRFSSEAELKMHIKENLQEGFFRGQFLKRKDRTYKANFIQSILSEFQLDGVALAKKIDKMSLEDFMNVYYETVGTIDITFNYDDNQSKDRRLATLKRTFANVGKEEKE
jgi:hypothetical protein